MRSVLASEKDCAAAFDARDGVVAKVHRPADRRVQLDKHRPVPRHVICGPGVEDLGEHVALLLVAKLGRV